MSGSMVLLQPRSVLMSVACATNEGQTDRCSVSQAEDMLISVVMLLAEQYWCRWSLWPRWSQGHVDDLDRCYCRGHRMVSVANASVEGHAVVVGLYCQGRPCWGLWHLLMQETIWKSVLCAVTRKHFQSMICSSADCKRQGSYFFHVIGD